MREATLRRASYAERDEEATPCTRRPAAHASWRNLLVGAAVTAVLLVASQALLGL